MPKKLSRLEQAEMLALPRPGPRVLRPYELRNRILLGDFYVYQPFNGKVFIEIAHGANAGEGATFPAHVVAQLISDFYDKEF